MRDQEYLGPERSRSETPILCERLSGLRAAIQSSRLSFPAQVPVFSREYRPDAQWRIVTLYFVRGWSFEQLAQRYGVTGRRIRQVIRKWAENAVKLGYLQRIPQEAYTDIGRQELPQSLLASAAMAHHAPANPQIAIAQSWSSAASLNP